jgi:hypothetical protein
VPTVILRPTGDYPSTTAYTLSKSAGDSYYSLINEEAADNDASYIFQAISSKSRTDNATVVFKWEKNTPVKILRVKMHFIAKTTSSASADTRRTSGYILLEGPGILFDGAPIDASAVSPASSYLSGTLTSSYADYAREWNASEFTYTNSALQEIIPTELVVNDFSLGTTFFRANIFLNGNKNSSKNDDFQNRITQVYLEVTYEDIETDSAPLYVKRDGAYAQAAKVYKKVDGAWVQQEDGGKAALQSGRYRLQQT